MLNYNLYYYLKDIQPLKNFDDAIDIEFWVCRQGDTLCFKKDYHGKVDVTVPIQGIMSHYAHYYVPEDEPVSLFHFPYGKDAFNMFINMIDDIVYGRDDGLRDLIDMVGKSHNRPLVEELTHWLPIALETFPEQMHKIIMEKKEKGWSSELQTLLANSNHYRDYIDNLDIAKCQKSEIPPSRYYEIARHHHVDIRLTMVEYCAYALGYDIEKTTLTNKADIVTKCDGMNVSDDYKRAFIQQHILVTDIKNAKDIEIITRWAKKWPDVIQRMVNVLSSQSMLKHHMILEEKCSQEKAIWKEWEQIIPDVVPLIHQVTTTEQLLQCSFRAALNHVWTQRDMSTTNEVVLLL